MSTFYGLVEEVLTHSHLLGNLHVLVTIWLVIPVSTCLPFFFWATERWDGAINHLIGILFACLF